MRSIWTCTVTVLLVTCSLPAMSDQFRGEAGIGIAGVVVEDRFGDELTFTESLATLSALYQLDEGFRAGIGVGLGEADNFEFNGTDIFGSDDLDVFSISAGYRFLLGSTSFFVLSASRARVTVRPEQSDESFRDYSTTVSGFVERDELRARYQAGVNYSPSGDFDLFGIAVSGTWFLSDQFGLGGSLGYAFGEDDFDTSLRTFSIGANLEFRGLH